MNEEIKALSDALNGKIDAIKTGTVSKAEHDALKTELEGLKSKGVDTTATDEINKKLDELSLEVKEVTTKGAKDADKSFYEALKDAISENKEALIGLKNSINGNVQLTVNKAVVNMTFATNSTGRIGRVETDRTQYGPQRKPLFVSQIISMSPTNARTFTYVDRTGHEGAPAMTAEGVLKPVGDWNLVETTVNPKKVAFIVTVSKEMLDDIDNMAQDVMMEIEEQILDIMEA